MRLASVSEGGRRPRGSENGGAGRNGRDSGSGRREQA